MYLLGVDNGGTAVKAALFDEDGRQIGVASMLLDSITPKQGYSERTLQSLAEANFKVIKRVIDESGVDAAKISGISFSGHGKGLYIVGEQGEFIYNAILSTDNRAQQIVEAWRDDGTADKAFDISLQRPLACQPVSILRWLKEEEPAVYHKIKHVFSVKDFIRYLITKEAYIEYTDASGANLLNLTTKTKDKQLLRLFGIEEIYEKLPPLKYSDDLCGKVTPEAAEQTGLAVGTPVVAGLFDIDACALASGLVEERDICMIAGTWSINEYISRTPIARGNNLNSLYVLPDYYLIEQSSATSAGNLEWFIKNLLEKECDLAAVKNQNIYEIVASYVADTDIEERIIFLPFLYGTNQNPKAKAMIFGLTENHNKKNLLRAVFEGVAFSHLTHYEKLLKTRHKPAQILLSGGASKSKIWSQIFADVMDTPVARIEDRELGAAGAAIVAGVGTKRYIDYKVAVDKWVKISEIVNPIKENVEIYRKKYKLYCQLNRGLEKVYPFF